jgi:TonB family protein
VYSIHSRRSFVQMALASANVSLLAAGNQGGENQDSKKQQESNKNDKKATEKPKSDEKIYVVGGDVKAPKLTHYVEPEFSSSSKEAFVDGVVKIETVVTSEGLPTNLKILSGLNTEEDKTAMEAVKQWRFRPGTKGDAPVNVKVTVEVDFHLL